MTSCTTADIRAAVRNGQIERAEGLCRAWLTEVVGTPVVAVQIGSDRYSLNSLNGIARSVAGDAWFFKFHQEEGEEQGVEEYYNARVLQEAGYPVALPVFQQNLPGRQVVVYPVIDSPRLSDVCSAIEHDASADDVGAVVVAQQAADRQFASIALATLRRETSPAARRQPFFQLFYNRTVDNPRALEGQAVGGRIARFYHGREVSWPGLTTTFDAVATLPWRINGVLYPVSLAECFERCTSELSPARFIPGPVITAHGDAHNANVWWHGLPVGTPRDDAELHSGPALSLFDPAFAGTAVPALLAEVKATFHNSLAHPFWLYEPAACEARFSAGAAIVDGELHVETDHALGPLRRAFLQSKASLFLGPLLAELHRRGQLSADWEETFRLALFACPTLVMPLLPGSDSTHNPVSSLIGFARAIQCASVAEDRHLDDVSRFFSLARRSMRAELETAA